MPVGKRLIDVVRVIEPYAATERNREKFALVGARNSFVPVLKDLKQYLDEGPLTIARRAHLPPLADARVLPRILIADADWATASTLRGALAGAAVCKILPSATRAQLEIAEIERYAALVIDPRLPDGSGVELARVARERSPSVALIIHSERFDSELLSQAFELEARWMPKPFAVRHRQALVTIVQRHHPVSDLVLAHSQLLTKKQQGILELLAAGIERPRICELQQISMATLKWHVRQILRKTGRERLSEVVLCVRLQSATTKRAPVVADVQPKTIRRAGDEPH